MLNKTTVTRQDDLKEDLGTKIRELEAQNGRLEQSNRLKSEFLANMSHELRTPLNAIIGFAELMHDGKAGPISSVQKDFLNDIITSSTHLLQLINGVLDLSKVESGKMEFRPEHVSIERLVGEVTDMVRLMASKKGIEIRTELDPAVPEVVIDPAKMKQVLYNYLSNAIKFTDKGKVTVRVGAQNSNMFRVEVEDTGVGIQTKDINRLFVEFRQLESSTNNQHQGTGLGLALTKRIVEAQGGSVRVHSVPGQGSVFEAVLPRFNRPLPE